MELLIASGEWSDGGAVESTVVSAAAAARGISLGS